MNENYEVTGNLKIDVIKTKWKRNIEIITLDTDKLTES